MIVDASAQLSLPSKWTTLVQISFFTAFISAIGHAPRCSLQRLSEASSISRARPRPASRQPRIEPSMGYADGVLSISKIRRATADCIYFWQNEAKMVNTFKGDRLNAALNAEPAGLLGSDDNIST